MEIVTEVKRRIMQFDFIYNSACWCGRFVREEIPEPSSENLKMCSLLFCQHYLWNGALSDEYVLVDPYNINHMNYMKRLYCKPKVIKDYVHTLTYPFHEKSHCGKIITMAADRLKYINDPIANAEYRRIHH